jgi:hypothetical protein
MGRRFTRRILEIHLCGSLAASEGGDTDPNKGGDTVDRNLLDAIEASDVAGASALLTRSIKEGIDPWGDSPIALSCGPARYESSHQPSPAKDVPGMS